MNTPQDNILKRIQTELTQPLWERLLLYAADLVRAHLWHGILGGPPLHGNCAADYVNIAAQKTINASRSWEPDKCTLEMHLKGAIRSEISHAAARVENTRVVRPSSLADPQADEPECPLDAFSDNSLSPEEMEILAEYDQTILEFLEALSDDIPVQRLFELIHDGIVKRAQQAKVLQMTETQVDAIKKRLATRVKKFAANRKQEIEGASHV